MFRCEKCGHIFEHGEQKEWLEERGELFGIPVYERLTSCPKCNGHYDKVKPCKICGSYAHAADEDFCDECKKAVESRFNNLIKMNFTAAERELINVIYDGRWI